MSIIFLSWLFFNHLFVFTSDIQYFTCFIFLLFNNKKTKHKRIIMKKLYKITFLHKFFILKVQKSFGTYVKSFSYFTSRCGCLYVTISKLAVFPAKGNALKTNETTYNLLLLWFLVFQHQVHPSRSQHHKCLWLLLE